MVCMLFKFEFNVLVFAFQKHLRGSREREEERKRGTVNGVESIIMWKRFLKKFLNLKSLKSKLKK